MFGKLNERNFDEAGGGGANPNPSDPQSQSLEANLPGLTAQLEKALKRLDAQDGEIRALKSGKDKAVDRALSEITPLKETLARVAKHLGVDEETVLRAQRELVLDDLVNRQFNAPQPPASLGGTGAMAGNQAELQGIDDLLDLPANDPRVTNLHLQYGHDVGAYKAQAKALKASFNQAAPTPAELPSNLQPVQQSRQPTNAVLQAAYEAERDKIVQAGYHTDERIYKLSELKQKYAAQGLPLL